MKSPPHGLHPQDGLGLIREDDLLWARGGAERSSRAALAAPAASFLAGWTTELDCNRPAQTGSVWLGAGTKWACGSAHSLTQLEVVLRLAALTPPLPRPRPAPPHLRPDGPRLLPHHVQPHIGPAPPLLPVPKVVPGGGCRARACPRSGLGGWWAAPLQPPRCVACEPVGLPRAEHWLQ